MRWRVVMSSRLEYALLLNRSDKRWDDDTKIKEKIKDAIDP